MKRRSMPSIPCGANSPYRCPMGCLPCLCPPCRPHTRATACRTAPGPPPDAAYAGLGLTSPGLDRPRHCPAPQDELAHRTARSSDHNVYGAQTPQRCRGQSLLNPYKPYLLERWNAGCYTAMRLFRDLQQHGYPGSYGPVAAYARRLRQAQGLAPGQRCPRQALPSVAEPVCQPLTPHRATWLVLRRATQRTEAETQQLTQLHAQHAEVAEAIDLAQAFAALVRQRQPAQARSVAQARDHEYAGG